MDIFSSSEIVCNTEIFRHLISGLMEFILEDTPEAKALRDHIVFKFGTVFHFKRYRH